MFLLGLSGLIGLILAAPYRISRLTAFLDPWQDPLGSEFQSIQSLLAIGLGDILGASFLRGKQKYFYLPEPHNDFIFAVIAEELGLIGAVVVIGVLPVTGLTLPFLSYGGSSLLINYAAVGILLNIENNAV